ncbi:hypothetical protein FPK53_28255, partial [Acinetobacter baumannii]|nr:hypothetical protein [Acinetobacter baumannii]
SRFRSMTDPRRLFVAAVVMGCAISGMHYTGMAAARFAGEADPMGLSGSNSDFLALSITVITVALSLGVVAANGLLRYRAMYL